MSIQFSHQRPLDLRNEAGAKQEKKPALVNVPNVGFKAFVLCIACFIINILFSLWQRAKLSSPGLTWQTHAITTTSDSYIATCCHPPPVYHNPLCNYLAARVVAPALRIVFDCSTLINDVGDDVIRIGNSEHDKRGELARGESFIALASILYLYV